MKKNNKKGFTIVELVIVIAVIAILAGVLIPTFTSVVRKARLSADQQAVNTINTHLAMHDDLDSIADVKIALMADDIDANNYKPLSKDHDFVWVPELNKVVLVDGDQKVVFPDNLVDAATEKKASWKSLSGVGDKAVVDKVTTGAIEAGAELNLMGGSINIKPTGNFTLGSADPEKPATIQNAVSDEGTKANATGDFVDNHYYAGLIATVPAGKTVVVENLVIDGAVIGDTTGQDSARNGIIAGQVAGVLIIRNVTIKNSTVFGDYRVGALVGAVTATGKVYIENVTLENVTVKGGTNTAALIGDVKETSVVKFAGNNVGFDNVKVEAIAMEGTVDEKDLITYINSAYPGGDSTCAYATTKWFWVQHGVTKNNGVDYSDGYVSNDEAMSTDWGEDYDFSAHL